MCILELEVGQGVAVLEVQDARCIATAEVVGRIEKVEQSRAEMSVTINSACGDKVIVGHFGHGKWRFLIEDPLDADKPLVFSQRSPFYWLVPLD